MNGRGGDSSRPSGLAGGAPAPAAAAPATLARTPAPSGDHLRPALRSTRCLADDRTPPSGLLNVGETCYLNSVVQVLYHMPAFRNALLRWERPAIAAERTNADDIVLELKLLFEKLAQRPPRSVDPTDLVDMLRDSSRELEFQADGQQDAHEFLRFLMDNVSTAMCPTPKTACNKRSPAAEASPSSRPRKRPRSAAAAASSASTSVNHGLTPVGGCIEEEILDGSDMPPNNDAQRYTVVGGGSNEARDDGAGASNGGQASTATEAGHGDPVRKIFEGESVTRTRCCECETSSRRWESFLDLSVPVTQGRALTGLLEMMAAGDMLDGSNKYACEVCLTKTEAERRFFLSKLPRVLTIHLKLFQFTEHAAGVKIPVATACPWEMRFKQWSTQECARSDSLYRLTAIIVHNGGYSTSGHYYAFIRRASQWFKFDDSTVTCTNETTIESFLFFSCRTKKTAYLLFYSADDCGGGASASASADADAK